MRFDWVIPCTSVDFPQGGGPITIHDAGFDCIQVRRLPQRITMTILLRIVGLPQDFAEDAPRKVEVYLNGPGMENLVALDFEIPSGEPGPDYDEGWEAWLFLPLAIRFTAVRPGPHMLELYLDTDRPEKLIDPGRRRSIPVFIEPSGP